jgi:hypothetical protein
LALRLLQSSLAIYPRYLLFERLELLEAIEPLERTESST